MKELILKPCQFGMSIGFIIPKRHMCLDYEKTYRLKIEEVK